MAAKTSDSRYETEVRIRQYDRLIRRLRADPRLFDEDDRVYDILGKALDRRAKIRRNTPKNVGVFSGLTRSELRRSGTCETDWF